MAWTRRHGPGRRKDDAHGRRISRRETYAADDPGGVVARQRAGRRDYSGTPQGCGLRIAVRHISGSRGAAGGFFRHAAGELVSIAADGALMKSFNFTKSDRENLQ